MQIRHATLADLNAIMAVEQASFGDGIAKEAMATREQMSSRLKLFAQKNFTEGFLLAEHKGMVVGYIIMFPTFRTPNQCVSWDVATDFGNIAGEFYALGRNIFVASLGVVASAPEAASCALIHATQVIRATRLRVLGYSHDHYMFCSRMPGYARAHKKTGISPEEYWRLEDTHGAPRDPLLNMFYQMMAEKPFKLLLNGYPPDHASAGHSVLFALEDTIANLNALAACMYNK